ncbi:hypothetical protein OHD62_21505 [Mesorhizobium sp. YC-39]|uniref:hypothetical protein n=1 Tax=unclassified Mesorhizobium TaxID=325217 RepID=UPI0021E6F156|nr:MULTISPECIES: hypothetical protein [unclassified Mesorhizobium]MCV3210720.1 hypothetical protein [Mesorhizobium sp. YC-2]MCV3230954.1 hypothetical protein [Mesorhizobium sp. YC-39]
MAADHVEFSELATLIVGMMAKGRAEKLELFDGWALDSETAASDRRNWLAGRWRGKSWTRQRKRTLLL